MKIYFINSYPHFILTLIDSLPLLGSLFSDSGVMQMSASMHQIVVTSTGTSERSLLHVRTTLISSTQFAHIFPTLPRVASALFLKKYRAGSCELERTISRWKVRTLSRVMWTHEVLASIRLYLFNERTGCGVAEAESLDIHSAQQRVCTNKLYKYKHACT